MTPVEHAEVEGQVHALLMKRLEDRELLQELEKVAEKTRFTFDGLTPLWGPALYQRNRTIFRAFILSHFSPYGFSPQKKSWVLTPWDSSLEVWLDLVDRDDEIELFRRLYRWRGFKSWQKDLLERFTSAAGDARNVVLDKMELGGQVDEAIAIELYRTDRSSSAFILRHLPYRQKKWKELWKLAESNRDEELYFALYRVQVPIDEWEKDALDLVRRFSDSETLIKELTRRHPARIEPKVGLTMAKLLEMKGAELLPYIYQHPHQVRSGYKALLALAKKNEWLDLWANLLRTCSTDDEYAKEVKALIAAGDRTRLSLLAGVAWEWNMPGFGIARVHLLPDEVAIALYDRFPDLLRGPFKSQISQSWGHWYPKLLARFEEAGEEELYDYLASRILTRHPHGDEQQQVIERLVAYYQKLDSARRSAGVIGLVPAYAIYNLGHLVRNNKLARLLYLRSVSTYLDDRVALRDLLESPSIHAQALAYRALGLDDPRAEVFAAENLDLLLATLLRPLHRATRRLAFGALERAALDAARAEKILDRARDALDLPDRRYPKEELIGLIGRLLHRYPELQTPGERPVIHRRHAS